MFKPFPHVKHQLDRSKPECQKERKRQWHKQKMLDDSEYKDDRRDAQRKWRVNNPDYWRVVPGVPPRLRQEEQGTAKGAQCSEEGKITSNCKTETRQGQESLWCLGFMMSFLSGGDKVAKMDVFRAEIRFISRC